MNNAKNHELVQLLNAALASALDLELAAKQAHWNVKGPNFFSLHQLFEQVYEAAGDWADDLAERAVQLGGVADPKKVTLGAHHTRAVRDRLSVFADQTRAAIRAAAELGDDVTSDLFNEVTAGADKQRWMVQAHLEA
jgi:starvation-inducible DNA-binding protein